MNPVFFHEKGFLGPANACDPTGWYFWTETWADYFGPFATEVEANEKLKEYVAHL
jgi:hypothetical protein